MNFINGLNHNQEIAITIIMAIITAIIIILLAHEIDDYLSSINKPKKNSKKVNRAPAFAGFAATPNKDPYSKSHGFTSSKALTVGSKIIETNESGKTNVKIIGEIQEEIFTDAIKIFIGGSDFSVSPTAVFDIDGHDRLEASELQEGMTMRGYKITLVEKIKTPIKLRSLFIQEGNLIQGIGLQVGDATITFYTSRAREVVAPPATNGNGGEKNPKADSSIVKSKTKTPRRPNRRPDRGGGVRNGNGGRRGNHR